MITIDKYMTDKKNENNPILSIYEKSGCIGDGEDEKDLEEPPNPPN